jgi:hypothetical protein
VTGVPGVPIQMAAGFNESCVVLPAGGVWCMGPDLKGELGDGTTNNSAAPVTVK